MFVRWLTAFVDLPADAFDVSAQFWCRVTGSILSPARGDAGQFATLLPPDGDAYLRVQRLDEGPAGCHLDVHVDDITVAAQRASDLGATVRTLGEVIVMTSPAGLPFCATSHHGERTRPAPVEIGARTRSIVDQLCLDIPPADHRAEGEFWAALTGWELREGVRPEFSYLARPAHMPVRLLLQSLDDEPSHDRRTGAHLDFACDDAEAVAAAHLDRGARLERRYERWISMRDPAGLSYCLTRRDPDTGVIAP